MGDSERRHLEELQRMKLHRLRTLERQEAMQGLSTPPQITMEIENLREEIASIEQRLHIAPTIDQATLHQLRQRALSAYWGEQWDQAIDLLSQVVKADPSDAGSQTKLAEAQQRQRVREDYDTIYELRDQVGVQVVQNALN